MPELNKVSRTGPGVGVLHYTVDVFASTEFDDVPLALSLLCPVLCRFLAWQVSALPFFGKAWDTAD